MILLADVTRYAVVVLALLNTAILMRLMWLRWRRHAPNLWEGSANYFTMTGLIVMMLVGMGRRLDSLGDHPDGWLWVSALGIGLVTFGLSRTVSLPSYGRHVRPANHRRDNMTTNQAPEPDGTVEADEGEPQPMPYTEESVQDDGDDIEDPPGFDDAAFDGSDNA